MDNLTAKHELTQEELSNATTAWQNMEGIERYIIKVDCPSCEARAEQACMTKSGRIAQATHAARSRAVISQIRKASGEHFSGRLRRKLEE